MDKLYKVKKGSKLSKTWLAPLKFTVTKGFFTPVTGEEVGLSKDIFEEDFEPAIQVFTADDMVDFAKTVKLMPENFTIIDIEAVKKWYFKKF